MERLDGKIAIITGAASGIGRATARRVAAEGARTVVADLNADGAKQVADEISAAGGEATAVQADLGDNDSVRAMVEAAVTAYGGLDILHNNAAATRLAATEGPAGERGGPGCLGRDDAGQPARRPGRHPGRGAAHDRPRRRLGHQHGLGRGPGRGPASPGLRRVQGRADQPDQVRGRRVRQAGHTVQRRSHPASS